MLIHEREELCFAQLDFLFSFEHSYVILTLVIQNHNVMYNVLKDKLLAGWSLIPATSVYSQVPYVTSYDGVLAFLYVVVQASLN